MYPHKDNSVLTFDNETRILDDITTVLTNIDITYIDWVSYSCTITYGNIASRFQATFSASRNNIIS